MLRNYWVIDMHCLMSNNHSGTNYSELHSQDVFKVHFCISRNTKDDKITSGLLMKNFEVDEKKA